MATTLPTDVQIVQSQALFDDYSNSYDMLAKLSPPYKELMQNLETELQSLALPPNRPIRVLDIGAGTGNFSKVLKQVFPLAKIDVLEPNQGMLEHAKQKLGSVDNTFYQQGFEGYQTDTKYDIILCYHALYLMDSPKLQLPKIKSLLKDTGSVFLCDIGKKINVVDWSFYLFRVLSKRVGIKQALNYFRQGKKITKANRKINKLQSRGHGWTHSMSDFRMYLDPFFKIQKSYRCYRGYSNFALLKHQNGSIRI